MWSLNRMDRVFVSSASNQFRSERKIAKDLSTHYPFLEVWVFEEEGATSASLEQSYPRPCQEISFAEIYDPSVAASTSTGSMNVARSGHLAVLLPNGQVLAGGGETENNVGKFSMTNTAELYTP
jgi:hypothetical protein